MMRPHIAAKFGLRDNGTTVLKSTESARTPSWPRRLSWTVWRCRRLRPGYGQRASSPQCYSAFRPPRPKPTSTTGDPPRSETGLLFTMTFRLCRSSKWHVYASSEPDVPAYTGSIWIDKESFGVLRIEISPRPLDLPASGPFRIADLCSRHRRMLEKRDRIPWIQCGVWRARRPESVAALSCCLY
jgi:hypothetical protein